MIHEGYITTSNVCTINDRASRYMTNIDRAKRVNKFTVVIGIVDETHSTNRKNVRMAINLNKKINQRIHLTHLDHSTQQEAEEKSFSSIGGTFSKTDNLLGYKINVNKYKTSNHAMYCDSNKIEL